MSNWVRRIFYQIPPQMEEIVIPWLKPISENSVRDYGYLPWIRIKCSFANGGFFVCFLKLLS